ncbi:ribosomal protein L1-like protein [Fimicolochytrium jonesii]|uniref:ribosomal protein L1-like protein n=1 Tax=Fimicolochytrium jonesii TaxID=1396493 RepID=UPI0022FE6D6E|nr:ribosomal protein L1-like protein [Fimicolochytrium jonesii]KAI8821810.1 ribosomal protein L1-like protein [Fimicolochytrium jonesii]
MSLQQSFRLTRAVAQRSRGSASCCSLAGERCEGLQTRILPTQSRQRDQRSSHSTLASLRTPFLSTAIVCTSTSVLRSPASLLPSPTHVPVRHYDRQKYLKQKKALKAKQNQEDITLEDGLEVFRKYCLGENRLFSAHVQVLRQEEGQRPIRGDVALPNQVSAEDKAITLVFATGEAADEAKRLGAHIVGGKELIEEIKAGKLDFDKVLSTKEMFPAVIEIARILGPKGLMPSPAKGTVSDDISSMMSSLRAVTKFEVDPDGFIHMEIGKTSWSDDKLLDNIKAFVAAVVSVRPPKTDATKFIQSVSISAKYTAGVNLPLKPFKALSGTAKK